MVPSVAIAVLFAAAVVCADPRYARTVRYDGEIVVRCPMDGPGVKKFLQQDFVDVWQIAANGMADVRVPRERYDRQDVLCTTVIDDVEAYVQRMENLTFPARQSSDAAEWFEEYHRYDDIVDWYRRLAEANPSLVKFTESIGKSVEGRDQPAVTITSEDGENKNKIYFQCQIHAREWISGATCNYIVNYIVEKNNEGDQRVTSLLKDVQFEIVPFVNPDGYEYTWTNSRLWRKNRKKGTLCDGVDLNRNYKDHWAQGGSSGSECSETYHGASAESEPETQNTAKHFRGLGNIVGAIDWHSYSQLILRPYGWTRTDCPDETQLKSLGDSMRDDIKEVHGKDYTSQKSIDLYITTGTASDWFYSDDANSNNEYRAAGFTIELRDTGRYGFQLPPEEIIPTGEEMIPAVLRFAESLSADPLKQ